MTVKTLWSERRKYNNMKQGKNSKSSDTSKSGTKLQLSLDKRLFLFMERVLGCLVQFVKMSSQEMYFKLFNTL